MIRFISFRFSIIRYCFYYLLATLLFPVSIAYSEDNPFIPIYRDATDKSGIPFVHESGTKDKDYIIEVNGAGVAIFDYDGDGDLDVYMINGSHLDLKPDQKKPTNKLYRNEGNWKFTDVTEEAGVGSTEWGCGSAVADYDNDSDLDLYVTNWGPNHLYRNNGDGTFTDVAPQNGMDDKRWGASCAFGDYDRDGDLDLYVACYLDFDPQKIPKRGERASCNLAGDIAIHCGPKGLTPISDLFFRNNGDGTFTDISDECGIRNVDNAFGLGVFFLDYDVDGFPDIYVSDDVSPNYLFRNKGDGTFEEVGLIAGVSYSADGEPQSGMGVDCGDLNGDGLEDIVVLNYAQDYTTFYRNDGDGFFTDASKEANLFFETYDYLAWGLIMVDAEYDGDLDLFSSNGHVIPQVDLTDAKQGYKQTNHLFLNDGNAHFTNVSDKAGDVFKVKLTSRGCAFGDLDNDGDQDIIVNNMDERPTIYENISQPGNHWIGVQLIGTTSNRTALGSWVKVKAGGKEYKKYHRGSFGYASQSELTLRFGLGKSASVDGIDVTWPSGTTESFTVDGVDKVISIKEGSSSVSQ